MKTGQRAQQSDEQVRANPAAAMSHGGLPPALHIRKLASRCRGQHERDLTFGFSDRSTTPAKLEENHHEAGHEAGGGSMSEFIRSGLIVLMAMTVMVAGILVIFYG